MRKQRRIKGKILDCIDGLARKGWPPAEIRRQLQEDALSVNPEWEEADVPSLPTIRDIVNEIRPKDQTGPWSLEGQDGADARLVLETSVAVLQATTGRVRHLTVREAEWVIRIRNAAPGLDPFDAWLIAREYMGRTDRADAVDDLDARLALTPPRGASSEERSDAEMKLGILIGSYWPNQRPSYYWDSSGAEAFLTGFLQTVEDSENRESAKWQLQAIERLAPPAEEIRKENDDARTHKAAGQNLDVLGRRRQSRKRQP